MSTILLVSCGSQPTPKQQAAVTVNQIQALLNEAHDSSFPEQQNKHIQAAELLLQEQQRELAAELLGNIDPYTLPLDSFVQYTRVSTQLYIQQGNYKEALVLLDAPTLIDNAHTLTIDLQTELSLLRAEVYSLTGLHMASAQQRIFIDPMLSRNQQKDNREGVWRSLMSVPTADLQGFQNNAFSREYSAWLALALLAKDSQGDLDAQLEQLENWQQQNSDHPANQTLPGGLALIKELAANRPEHVALLLPLKGRLAPFGKAIRDGFIAAMYQTRQRGSKVPTITVYNTQDTATIAELYQQAVSQGAEMIVGPLEKSRVRLLFDEDITVPTLALNRIDDYGDAPQQLFQFSLSPQDEAKQIANIAFLDKHQQAMIIAPQGEWGEKVTLAFNQRWQTLGGEVMANSIYTSQKDYSSSVKQSLLLDDSEARAKRIEQLIGERVEFFPRRRQDIDMILLLARPQQARSIKPLMAYHYAGDIPVYGTSRLYSGYTDKAKDRDINGIRFTDMPWVLEQASPLHRTISQEIISSKEYQRMYALGIDSFNLHPRLRQLKEIPNSRVYGETGTLKLNEKQQIERQLLFAHIKSSIANIIPVSDKAFDLNNLITKDGDITHGQQQIQ